jgi:DNA-binding XRE family transcriptional regulator
MPRYVSPAQIRAARGLLGWTSTKLAEKLGVSRQTVKLLESKDEARNLAMRNRAQALMERHGVLFLDVDRGGGEGVRFNAELTASDAPLADNDRL